ncbi:preprotein translocase subunit SecE [candidate division WOR-3 bacterium]|nr:preprotein translocase subunit SecE [candidate division WOR-3 bacterium]
MLEKIVTFFKEVKQELFKVSWPKGKEVWASTGVVIVFSVILSVIIYVLDLLFQRVFLFLIR